MVFTFIMNIKGYLFDSDDISKILHDLLTRLVIQGLQAENKKFKAFLTGLVDETTNLEIENADLKTENAELKTEIVDLKAKNNKLENFIEQEKEGNVLII